MTRTARVTAVSTLTAVALMLLGQKRLSSRRKRYLVYRDNSRGVDGNGEGAPGGTGTCAPGIEGGHGAIGGAHGALVRWLRRISRTRNMVLSTTPLMIAAIRPLRKFSNRDAAASQATHAQRG